MDAILVIYLQFLIDQLFLLSNSLIYVCDLVMAITNLTENIFYKSC